MAKTDSNPSNRALGPTPAQGLKALRLLAFLALGGLASCGGSPPPPTATAPPPAAPPVAPAPVVPEPETPGPIAGLTPLPSPAQVVNGLPQGRIDPFAPVASASATTDASGKSNPNAKPPLQLPEGFSFSGVVSTRGKAQALVQVGGQTGPLCVGPRGFCPGSGIAPLLPAGWTVTSINVGNGLLSLRQGGQSVTLTL